MKKILLTFCIVINSLLLFGQTGNAIYFDNFDDSITVPNASALIANSTTMSMTFWVYPQNSTNVFPDLDGYAGFRNNTDADFYLVQLNSTDLEPRFRNSAGTNFDFVYSGLQLNVWQHFVMTYDGANLKLYHNSALVGLIPANGVITINNDPFYIGLTPWPGAPFYLNGKIDEVSLWSKTLSQAEIDCIYNGAIDPASPDLELYYRFNQGVAGGTNTTVNTLTDATGSINGVMTGFALTGTSSNWVSGISTANSSSITDTICPGTSYVFGSQVITAPGNYFETFSTSGGCDSIAELTLTTVAINISVSQSGTTLFAQQSGAQYQWISCSNGNTPIPGATAQTYVATANGQYAAIVTLGGCSDTTVCATVTTVGLTELNNASVSTIPNPFNDQLTVTFPVSMLNKTMVVYDVTGRKIFTGIINNTKMELPVASWNASFYFLSVEGVSGRMKLIRQ